MRCLLASACGAVASTLQQLLPPCSCPAGACDASPHTSPPRLSQTPTPKHRSDGCHHCGTRRGPVIGDHMPPNKHVKEYVKTARRSLLSLPGARQMAEALNIPTGPPRQRYYPQCGSCSQKQSTAIRNNKVRGGWGWWVGGWTGVVGRWGRGGGWGKGWWQGCSSHSYSQQQGGLGEVGEGWLGRDCEGWC